MRENYKSLMNKTKTHIYKNNIKTDTIPPLTRPKPTLILQDEDQYQDCGLALLITSCKNFNNDCKLILNFSEKSFASLKFIKHWLCKAFFAFTVSDES